MPGVFITATGTDVGKTFVTAGLLRAAHRANRAVSAMKPVLSGFDPAKAQRSDAGVLLAALGRDVTPAALEAISPWRFAAPLSPDMAATAEGRALVLADVVAACRAALTTDALVFVEGVGGVMVPLNAHHTVLDWMAELALPVVLVTPTGLGAISHCLTAASVLAARGLPPTMIVLNETDDSSVPLAATEATLRSFLPGAGFAIVSRGKRGDATGDGLAADELFDGLLARLLETAVDLHHASSPRDGSAA